MADRVVYQFHISLDEISPQIWRRILVPERYSFWDLHVAIQDSMGWLDYHLHAFRFGGKKSRSRWEIGIPDDDEFMDRKVLPGWEVPIVEHFQRVGSKCVYEYDFGDGWCHEVKLEGILLGEKGTRYPQCIAGERACPPEDCGGVYGYYDLLEVLTDPADERYEEMTTWLGKVYEPEDFRRDEVKFDNPKKRWEYAFKGDL